MGPLAGVKVVEMAGIGPAPFCGMLLADLGAEVLRIDRIAASDLGFGIEHRFDLPNRSKRAVAADLKSPDGIALVRELAAKADLLIEGYRPGVMERLGLGPEVLLTDNPRLIYGRMTGWGQTGPLRDRAGHDINYIALTGALAAIGPEGGAPVAPLNLVGDFGGGSLYLALGLLAALIEARHSGKGQVIDAAMVDGASNLMTMHHGYLQAGLWNLARGTNAVDGGAPYYTTYETHDGKWMAVGAVEKRFYTELIERLGLAGADLPGQNDRARWPELRSRLAEVFASKTRDDWESHFEGSDACVSPVLDMEESRTHPLALARGLFADIDGTTHPAPAPKFSRTPARIGGAPPDPATDGRTALAAWGIAESRIEGLAAAKAIL